MTCERNIEVGTKAEKKVCFAWADFELDGRLGEGSICGELTLIMSRECRRGGFVDNKSIPDACESPGRILWGVQEYSHTDPPLPSPLLSLLLCEAPLTVSKHKLPSYQGYT